jgi:glucose/arabinose dehydrogenase
MHALTWRKTGVYVLVALPVLGLAGIVALARQHQQETPQQATSDPVADAARKAREQKKAEPKPKKVYTNEDFGSGTPAPAAATPPNGGASTAENKEGANAAANGDKASAEDAGGASKNSEEGWRKRFREARDKLAQAEQELDILQREAQKAQVQYYNDPQKALSEQYTRKDVTEKDTKIEAKKQEIAQMKQHIADMEDELRKSGGDSGWAR